MLLDADPARAFMPYPGVQVPHDASGPLSGLTFAVKDLFDVAGYPTGGGSPHVLALSGVKSRTAPTVQRYGSSCPSSVRFTNRNVRVPGCCGGNSSTP